MAEELLKMINVFVEWLPDMDILFNENDECRLVIPWDEKQALLRKEEQGRLHPIQGGYNNRYPENNWRGIPPF